MRRSEEVNKYENEEVRVANFGFAGEQDSLNESRLTETERKRYRARVQNIALEIMAVGEERRGPALG